MMQCMSPGRVAKTVTGLLTMEAPITMIEHPAYPNEHILTPDYKAVCAGLQAVAEGKALDVGAN